MQMWTVHLLIGFAAAASRADTRVRSALNTVGDNEPSALSEKASDSGPRSLSEKERRTLAETYSLDRLNDKASDADVQKGWLDIGQWVTTFPGGSSLDRDVQHYGLRGKDGQLVRLRAEPAVPTPGEPSYVATGPPRSWWEYAKYCSVAGAGVLLMTGIAYASPGVPQVAGAKSEKVEAGGPKVVCLALTWMALSASLTVTNKEVFSTYAFPHPAFLTAYHQLLLMVFTQILYVTPLAGALMPAAAAQGRLAGLSLPQVLASVGPYAALAATTLALGNQAYVSLSVAFIQMIKAAMPIFVFVLSCIVGLEQLCALRAWLVTVACFGTVAVARGEVVIEAVGFAFQLTAFVAEGARLIMMKTLVSMPSLDPLSMAGLLAPMCLLLLLPQLLLFELSEISLADVRRAALPLALSGLIALSLNIVSLLFMRAASPTKYALCGMAKDVLIVFGSLWWFHDTTTTLQMGGFVLALVSTNLFVYHERNGYLPLLSSVRLGFGKGEKLRGESPTE